MLLIWLILVVLLITGTSPPQTRGQIPPVAGRSKRIPLPGTDTLKSRRPTIARPSRLHLRQTVCLYRPRDLLEQGQSSKHFWGLRLCLGHGWSKSSIYIFI